VGIRLGLGVFHIVDLISGHHGLGLSSVVKVDLGNLAVSLIAHSWILLLRGCLLDPGLLLHLLLLLVVFGKFDRNVLLGLIITSEDVVFGVGLGGSSFFHYLHLDIGGVENVGLIFVGFVLGLLLLLVLGVAENVRPLVGLFVFFIGVVVGLLELMRFIIVILLLRLFVIILTHLTLILSFFVGVIVLSVLILTIVLVVGWVLLKSHFLIKHIFLFQLFECFFVNILSIIII